MYYFKEILYDNRSFIIYRHPKGALGVFIEKNDERDTFQLLKFVSNTKQCREIIRNYKEYETEYGYGCFLY